MFTEIQFSPDNNDLIRCDYCNQFEDVADARWVESDEMNACLECQESIQVELWEQEAASKYL